MLDGLEDQEIVHIVDSKNDKPDFSFQKGIL